MLRRRAEELVALADKMEQDFLDSGDELTGSDFYRHWSERSSFRDASGASSRIFTELSTRCSLNCTQAQRKGLKTN